MAQFAPPFADELPMARFAPLDKLPTCAHGVLRRNVLSQTSHWSSMRTVCTPSLTEMSRIRGSFFAGTTLIRPLRSRYASWI